VVIAARREVSAACPPLHVSLTGFIVGEVVGESLDLPLNLSVPDLEVDGVFLVVVVEHGREGWVQCKSQLAHI
jgi:hypothetical protein